MRFMKNVHRPCRSGTANTRSAGKICPAKQWVVFDQRFFVFGAFEPLAMGGDAEYMRPCPISHVPVVVCQSVGIRTRGRTAARDGKRMEGDGYPLKSRSRLPPEGSCHRTATGSRRRNRRTPNLHGGRSLKQRRNGLFLVSPAFHRPAPKRLVLHCRPCGVFPNRTVFRVRTDRPL